MVFAILSRKCVVIFHQKRKKSRSKIFENVKYCKLIVSLATICLIFICSAPDESSYCYVNTASKKEPIFFTKSQKLSYYMSQFCQSNNADDKSKTKIATKNNRLKFETISMIEI